ncbi:MAG: VCBS repeat-containing protein [Acidobacteriota bacterium]
MSKNFFKRISPILTLIVVVFSLNAFGYTTDAIILPTIYDFDGDRKADETIYRNGLWFVLRSGGGVTIAQWGNATDNTVTADYDGDGKSDIAVFRNGAWYILRSSDNGVSIISWGAAGDIPVTGDFDGDGKSDITVFRNGSWYILNQVNNSVRIESLGTAGDKPVAGDFDGDGIQDPAVYHAGVWSVLRSTDHGLTTTNWGNATDIPVAADYDGDGKTDFAFYRGGTWYTLNAAQSVGIIQWGLPSDVPVVADYDGDRKSDITVYRATDGNWYSLASLGGVSIVNWGRPGDIPIQTPINGGTNPGPTPTPTPIPTPTPSFTCDYYASPTGLSTGTGSSTGPWDLQTALGKTTLVRNGKTLCLKGGTYRGKFISTLNGGGTVRSAPSEWAILDGNVNTSLTATINSTQTSMTLANAASLLVPGGSDEIGIDGEVIKFCTKSGNNLTGCVRAASGTIGSAAPHSSGAVVQQAGPNLNISGSGSVYRDFEVKNSYAIRSEPLTTGITQGNGVHVTGTDNSLINLIVHDCLEGIFASSTTSNTLIYGVLVYNNGNVDSAGAGHGHGFYLENASGYSRLYDSISLNSFNLGMQGFGQTGPYVGGDIQGSVFAGAGAPLGQYHYNMVYGPANQISPTATVNACHFYHPPGSSSYSVNFGYGAGITSGTFTNNYFVGAGTAFEAQTVTNLTFTGNKFYSPVAGDVYTIARSPGYMWNNNTYYNTTTQARLAKAGVGNFTFALWKPIFGYDATSTAIGSALPDQVIVRPNSYQAGRATLIIYAPSGATSINANFSTIGLADGQSYTIKNAFNWYGSDVANGTYSSSNPVVGVPLNVSAKSVATPTGWGTTPATSCPNLCLLVVVPN